MRIPVTGVFRILSVASLLAAPGLVSGQMEEMEKSSDVKISRAAICMQVEEREPAEIDTVFRPDVGQLYAFTQVEGIPGPTRITHVWYHGDQEMFRKDLQIGNNGWRTWTSKKILPSWTGPWKVAILDQDGAPLKTLEFTIAESTSSDSQSFDD